MAMAGQVDAAEMLSLLESSELAVVDEIKQLILENLQNSKETWLVSGLVDSFMVSNSQRCLDILASLGEPHDKHLFDRMVEHLRGSNRIGVLAILGHLVRKQPIWLHKIVHHYLLSAVLKCLKTETDVPVLLCGVLTVTSLLPVIPVSISKYLPEIFAVFCRLAAFVAKSPGNVPRVYFIHLLVGLYSLFHRLYAMYPCHFLTYLRGAFCKKEDQRVFDTVIKPMLEKVRMHPLLVTATKDREVSLERWRQMEVHDIMVECARLSLDPGEGTSEEEHVSSFSSGRDTPWRCVEHTSEPLTPGGRAALPYPADPLQDTGPVTSSVLSHMDSNAIWSPSSRCGLSTPPPLTPGGSTSTEGHILSQGSSLMNTPLRGTAWGQVPDSPLPVHAEATDRTPGKRLSAISLSLAGKGQIPLDGGSVEGLGSGSGSVPPSPLRSDFTSEPPLHAHNLQAIRRLTFQFPEERLLAKDALDALHVGKATPQSPREGVVSSQTATPPSPKEMISNTPSSQTGGVAHRTVTAGTMTTGPATAGTMASGPATAGTMASGPATAGTMATGPATTGTMATGPATAGTMATDTVTTGSSAADPVSSRSSSRSATRLRVECSARPPEEGTSKSGDPQPAPSTTPLTPQSATIKGDPWLGQPSSEEDGRQVLSPEQDFLDAPAPSVSQLSSFIDGLEPSVGGVDGEVSELTQLGVAGDCGECDGSDGSTTPSHLPQDLVLTAQSVAAFMKKVNRIRFNSMNVIKDAHEKYAIARAAARSMSCPDLEEGQSFDESDDGVDAGAELGRRRGSNIPQKSDAAVSAADDVAAIGLPLATTGKMAAPATAHVTSTCEADTQTYLYVASVQGRPEGEEAVAECADWDLLREFFPYEGVFSRVLPFAPFVHCYGCMVRQRRAPPTPPAPVTPPVKGSQPAWDCWPVQGTMATPAFLKAPSPAEVLDRHLRLTSQAPSADPSRGLTPGAPSGRGTPSAMDEASILRGQISMLHNQLLFERHKRELHARRNRRLLGRLVKTTVLQEKTNAMEDQLQLQEKELHNLRLALRQQQQQNNQLKVAKDNHETERDKQKKSYLQEIDSCKTKNKELEELLESVRKERNSLNKTLKTTQCDLFGLQRELEAERGRSENAADLQLKIQQLNKELMLMGELQQKYQDRLGNATRGGLAKLENPYLIDSYKAERAGLKSSLDQRTVQLEFVQAKLTDTEEELKKKDLMVAELRKEMGNMKELYTSQLRAVEKKYEAEKKVQLALQTEFFNLYDQLSRLQTPPRPAAAMAMSAALMESAAGECAASLSTTADGAAVGGASQGTSHITNQGPSRGPSLEASQEITGPPAMIVTPNSDVSVEDALEAMESGLSSPEGSRDGVRQ